MTVAGQAPPGHDDPADNAPLAGTRVLDLSRYVSGPSCGRLLADLGADVVKVEPPEGDPSRSVQPKVGSSSIYFTQQNAGKRSLCVDLRAPGGAELVARLATNVDVLLENFRSGVLARQRLDSATLLERNPSLIYCSITGYGQTGVWSGRRAFAPLVHAEAGTLELAARKRGARPAPEVQSHGDVYPGMLAANAILAALLQRQHTGLGQHIDVSMAEALVYTNEWSGVEVHGFEGVQLFGAWNAPVTPLSDGRMVAFAGNPIFTFPRWAAAMGTPELLQEERFATVEARQAHAAEVHALIADFVACFDCVEAVEEALEPHNVPVGLVRSLPELAASAWAVERGVFTEPEAGVVVPAAPWRSSASTVGLAGKAAGLGEHNREVLREVAGMTDAEINGLEASGVIGSGRGGER